MTLPPPLYHHLRISLPFLLLYPNLAEHIGHQKLTVLALLRLNVLPQHKHIFMPGFPQYPITTTIHQGNLSYSPQPFSCRHTPHKARPSTPRYEDRLVPLSMRIRKPCRIASTPSELWRKDETVGSLLVPLVLYHQHPNLPRIILVRNSHALAIRTMHCHHKRPANPRVLEFPQTLETSPPSHLHDSSPTINKQPSGT